MKIIPEESYAKVDEAIANAKSPRHKAMLENYREHMAAEIDGDVERIMATQVAEPRYHLYGQGTGDHGPKGQREVRQFYEHIFANRYNKLRYDIERIFCTDDYLFHEGTLNIVFPGATLKQMGMPVDDADAWYLYSYHTCAIFPYDENGLAKGEDVFSDGPMSTDRLRKLAPEELPDGLV